jgi:hypothetical protein
MSGDSSRRFGFFVFAWGAKEKSKAAIPRRTPK